jgi:hypothetical protein
MAAALSPEEYDELKQFLGFYSVNYMEIDKKLPPHLRPLALLELVEKRSRKQAQQGLRQAINDVIEHTRHLSYKEVKKIDFELIKNCAITLSELRRRFSREYNSIVKRKKINNETEYYLIRGMLDDGAARIGEDERKLLARLIAEFENRIG